MKKTSAPPTPIETHTVTLSRDQWLLVIAVVDTARERFKDDPSFQNEALEVLGSLARQTDTKDLLHDVPLPIIH